MGMELACEEPKPQTFQSLLAQLHDKMGECLAARDAVDVPVLPYTTFESLQRRAAGQQLKRFAQAVVLLVDAADAAGDPK